jgi:hypothetical protein
MCFLGLFGIILMIIGNEITFRRIGNKDTNISWFIKLMITISTVFLVSLVIAYHHFNFKLYTAQNSLDSWHVGLTMKRIFLIICEIVICSIHPMPRYFPQNWLSKHQEMPTNFTLSDSIIPSSVSPFYVSTDVALGLPSIFSFNKHSQSFISIF